MKQNTILLLLFLFFGAGIAGVRAQSLIIRLNDGTENTELLNTIQHLSFTANDLLVAFKSGTTDNYELSGIRKLYFDNATSTGEMLPAGNAVSLYPNPATESLVVSGLPTGTTQLMLYSSDGRLIRLIGVSSGSETIDVSMLKSGLYFLTANGCSIKFIRL